MINLRTVVIPLALALLALGACDDGRGISPGEPTPRATAVTETESLADELRDAGMTVEEGGEASVFFFSVPGTALLVDGGRVEVYEYGDEASAEGDAARISPDGFQVEVPANGGMAVSMVEWIATPHFYRKGRLIALYVGEDADLIVALEAALGPQFAGG